MKSALGVEVAGTAREGGGGGGGVRTGNSASRGSSISSCSPSIPPSGHFYLDMSCKPVVCLEVTRRMFCSVLYLLEATPVVSA